HRLEGGASGEALGCGAAACAVQGLERPIARAPRACLDVLAPYVGAPALDAANEAAARRRDFVRVGGDRTGELDRPQLSGEPPGQVRYAAGMHAAATQGWVAGRDPWTGPAVSGHRPAKVAERTDGAGAQELIGDHRDSRLRSRASPSAAERASSSRPGTGSGGSVARASTVACTCSTYVTHQSHITRCSSTWLRVGSSSAPSR